MRPKALAVSPAYAVLRLVVHTAQCAWWSRTDSRLWRPQPGCTLRTHTPSPWIRLPHQTDKSEVRKHYLNIYRFYICQTLGYQDKNMSFK